MMSNTNNTADFDVRIQGQSNRPFWLLSEHYAYNVYLDGSQLQSSDDEYTSGQVKQRTHQSTTGKR